MIHLLSPQDFTVGVKLISNEENTVLLKTPGGESNIMFSKSNMQKTSGN